MNIFDFFTPKSETFYLYDDSTIRQAIEKFDYHKFTVVPLIDRHGKYLATVSEGDILRHIKNVAHFDLSAAEHTCLKDIEKYRAYKALDLRGSLDDVLELSLEQNFIPLVDDKLSYIGILKRQAVLKFLYQRRK